MVNWYASTCASVCRSCWIVCDIEEVNKERERDSENERECIITVACDTFSELRNRANEI